MACKPSEQAMVEAVEVTRSASMYSWFAKTLPTDVARVNCYLFISHHKKTAALASTQYLLMR